MSAERRKFVVVLSNRALKYSLEGSKKTSSLDIVPGKEIQSKC